MDRIWARTSLFAEHSRRGRGNPILVTEADARNKTRGILDLKRSWDEKFL